MMSIIHNNTTHKSSLYSTYGILILFCLDLVTYIPFVPVNISKSVVLLLSSYCFIRTYYLSKHKFETSGIDILILLYSIMLLVRLFVDFVVKGQTFHVYSNTVTVFVFALGIIYIPLYAIRKTKLVLDTHKLTLGLYWVLLVCMILSARNISSGMAEEVSGGRFDANEGLFSILYGHLGVSLVFTSLCLKFTHLKHKIRIIMTIVGVFVGALSLIYSGSRGPFLALLVALLLYLSLFVKNKGESYLLVIVFFFLIINIGPLIEILNDFLQSNGINSFYRVYLTVAEGGEGGSGREDLWSVAIHDMMESPFWGEALLFKNGSYVHNIFIEQFRALGLFGGMFFLIFNIILVFRGLRICGHNKNYLLFYLLYIQYLIMGCFTSTIIVLSQYWLFMIIVYNLCKQYGKGVSYNTNIQE